jgi:Tfp pilus assembly protein PilV
MKTNYVDSRGVSSKESGIGIIEIIVAMLLLALLVLSFAPVLITTIKLSARNTTIATATQIVNQQIEAARAVSTLSAAVTKCTDVVGFIAVTPAPVVDPRGVILQPVWDAITCPLIFPGVVKVRVSVTQAGYSSATASATTLILVTAP